MPEESGTRVETHRLDTKKLASLLDGGLPEEVYVFGEEHRMDRYLVTR